jgi:BirA family biotin operon repressor/biotin-[acetyl-CoA-carboxylase] ligase
MDENSLCLAVDNLPIPAIRYYETIGSTNDAAADWAQNGAADYSLVVANKQTAGRGRLNRQWITVPGSSLAFSIILIPSEAEAQEPTLFTALGALAICEALAAETGLPGAEVKWPNDVLLNRKKTAGILVESNWIGNRVKYIILGIGINISAGSVPPADQVLFPATCLEEFAGKPIDREQFLASVVGKIIEIRPGMLQPSFLETWNSRLAYRNLLVNIEQGNTTVSGTLLMIDAEGNLILRGSSGEEIIVSFGDVRLRPAAGCRQP